MTEGRQVFAQFFFASANGRHVLVYGEQAGSSLTPIGMVHWYGPLVSPATINAWHERIGRWGLVVAAQVNYDVAAPVLCGSVEGRPEIFRIGPDDYWTFSGGPVPGGEYDHDRPASLEALVGDWGSSPSNSIAIRPDGTVTVASFNGGWNGGLSGPLAGTIRPAQSGKNTFELSLGPVLPPLPGALRGQAFVYRLASGGERLVAWALFEDEFPSVLVLMADRR